MRSFQRALFALTLMVLAGGACLSLRAQQGSSNGDVFNASSPFVGQDPLAGRAVVMPQASTGKCIPPRNSNWNLLAQQSGDCYYIEPFAKRLNGYVANMSDVGAVERLGGRCGVDEFDGGKAVCFNAGDELPGAPPTTGHPSGTGISPPNNPPGGSDPVTGGTPANRGTMGRGGASAGGNAAATGGYSNPCQPNYDMSTPAGRAKAVQLAAQTKQACDEYRCKHNPQLPVCTTIVEQPPTGPKSLNREPESDQPAQSQSTPPASPNLLAIQKAMNTCLSARVPYWVATKIQSQYMQKARDAASASVRSTPPETLPYQTQVFLVETAMALQAQALHDSKYGQVEYDPTYPHDTSNPAYAPYYLAGWLDSCVRRAGLEPLKDPRPAYAQFTGLPVNDPRRFAYSSGYTYGTAPWTPATLQPSPSLH